MLRKYWIETRGDEEKWEKFYKKNVTRNTEKREIGHKYTKSSRVD